VAAFFIDERTVSDWRNKAGEHGQRVHDEIVGGGAVYNFCSVHSSLLATPTMAADLTDHGWSVPELLSRYEPRKQLQVGV
jgi:hypothetical protein